MTEKGGPKVISKRLTVTRQKETEDPPWHDVPAGRRIVAGFVVLTLLAVAGSIGMRGDDGNALLAQNVLIPLRVPVRVSRGNDTDTARPRDRYESPDQRRRAI